MITLNQNNNSAAKSGIIGMVLGMVAGASLVFFAEPKNRTRIKDGVDQLDSDARNKLSDLKSSVAGANSKTKKALARNLKTFAQQLEAGK